MVELERSRAMKEEDKYKRIKKIMAIKEKMDKAEEAVKFNLSCEYALKHFLIKYGNKIEITHEDMRVIEQTEIKLHIDYDNLSFSFELYFKPEHNKSMH